jgi:hypothetical protein
MEIGELKKMLKRSTAVLILENGDPSIVVVDYKTYKELLGEDKGEPGNSRPMPTPPAPSTQASGPASTAELELLERINKDILALKEQIEEEEKGLDL